MVQQGRITQNEKTIESPGTIIDEENDIIKVDGAIVAPNIDKIYVLLNKPKNVITSLHDPFKRKTVAHFLSKIKSRIYPVGRLDFDTDGVLLMTNDGEMAFRLAHPKYEVEKVYSVIVEGPVTTDDIKTIAKGIKLQDGHKARARADIVKSSFRTTKLTIMLTEGRKREIKQIFKNIGHPVINLRRVKFAGIKAGDLKPGKWRYLEEDEVNQLRNLVGL